MENTIKIAIGQVKVVPGQPEVNFEKIKGFVTKAKKAQCDFVIFPEMAIPGYLLSDLWEEDAYIRDCDFYTQKIAKLSKGITIIFGNVLPDYHESGNDGRLKKFNAAFVAHNGILEHTIKTHEPLYREFEDQRHFVSLKEYSQQIDKPIEDLLTPFTINNIKIGVVICEDVWIKDYRYNNQLLNPAEILALKGAKIIIAVSSSPYGLRKDEARRRNLDFIQKQLWNKGFRIPLVYINNVGWQNNGKNEFGFDGRSIILDAAGNQLFEAPMWQEGLFFYNLNLNSQAIKFENWEVKRDEVGERREIREALIQGIKEFANTKNIQNIVIGLSGGIDSALVAYLCTKAIGPEHVFGINMPSKFNSDWTKSVAAKVAKNLEINYQVIPIEDIAELLRQKIKLEGVPDENMQARIRSADILAGVAATLNHAVYTCNGNKTEILFGWFTLDGDGRGALCPLGDLYKTQVAELAAQINIDEGKEIFPWELIAPIISGDFIPVGTQKLVPSAELSVRQDVNLGLGDPIIFPYHDQVLRQWVEYRYNIEDTIQDDIIKNLGKKYFKTTKEWLTDLEKTWQLYHLAVFKQIQSPPILTISKRGLGYDFRRSQLPPHLTKKYHKLRENISYNI